MFSAAVEADSGARLAGMSLASRGPRRFHLPQPHLSPGRRPKRDRWAAASGGSWPWKPSAASHTPKGGYRFADVLPAASTCVVATSQQPTGSIGAAPPRGRAPRQTSTGLRHSSPELNQRRASSGGLATTYTGRDALSSPRRDSAMAVSIRHGASTGSNYLDRLFGRNARRQRGARGRSNRRYCP